MGVGSSLLLLIFIAALLAGLGYAAYLGYQAWEKSNEERLKQADISEKQQKMLQDYNKRLSVMDSTLSESQRQALDDMQERERLKEKIDENKERIKRHAAATRLKDAANAVRLRTQSVRLKNPDAGEEGGEGGEEGTDHENTIRLGNAPIDASDLGGDEKDSVDNALHVTDGDVTEYAPLMAGKMWSAEGVLRLGGNGAHISLGEDDRTRIEVRDRLFAPYISAESMEVTGDSGIAIFPGANSSHNPEGLKTYFGKAGDDGRNYIRGDTDIAGDVKTDGRLDAGSNLRVRGNVRVDGTTRMKGAAKREFRNIDRTGLESIIPNTVFSNSDGVNSIEGDTVVNGLLYSVDPIVSQSPILGEKTMGVTNDGDTPVGLESGFDGGARSALTFNGSSLDHTNLEGVSSNRTIHNEDKGRWRVLTDQGAGRDAFRVDRTISGAHPDNETSGNQVWVPVSIENGVIKFSGDVQACDRDGNNCRGIRLQNDEEDDGEDDA